MIVEWMPVPAEAVSVQGRGKYWKHSCIKNSETMQK